MKFLTNPVIKKIARSVLGYMLLAAIAVGCVSKAENISADPQAAAPAGIPATPVDGVVIQPGVIRDELEVTGTLVANQEVDIVSELTRKVVRVHVKEGSKVREGDLLFQLDDADLQAQLERLRQQEKLAILNEERLKDLIAHEAIAQQDYDEAFTNLSVLKAQVRELQVAISKTRITAPFSGQIGIINIYPGSIVSVNTTLTNIEDISVIKVEFTVPEKYTNVIEPGTEHSFTIASDQKSYKTRVTARAAGLSESTRTLLVRAVTANPDGRLLPGQSARLNLTLNMSSQALTVSSNALIPSSKGYTVYVSRKNKVVPIAVEIGQRGAGTVEITGGLQKGDTIITSNLLRLVPGADVQFVTLQ